MKEEIAYFDGWIHFLEILIVVGIGLVVWAAKKAQSNEKD